MTYIKDKAASPFVWNPLLFLPFNSRKSHEKTSPNSLKTLTHPFCCQYHLSITHRDGRSQGPIRHLAGVLLVGRRQGVQAAVGGSLRRVRRDPCDGDPYDRWIQVICLLIANLDLSHYIWLVLKFCILFWFEDLLLCFSFSSTHRRRSRGWERRRRRELMRISRKVVSETGNEWFCWTFVDLTEFIIYLVYIGCSICLCSCKLCTWQFKDI